MDSTNFKHLTANEQNDALRFAAAYGDINTVKILIAMGKVDVNSQDKFGKTALLWAVKNKCADIVDILTTAGANLHIADYNGETPHMLMKVEPKAELIENKENRYFNDENRGFPLHHYYNPVIFSSENDVTPLRERNRRSDIAKSNHSNVSPQPNNTTEYCCVM